MTVEKQSPRALGWAEFEDGPKTAARMHAFTRIPPLL